ncbi:hypothetical protein OG369_39910 [Streptomyces sp. NBC_01221]|uniref:hypothetical protein n=1 Tax=Streptomyces sp. NBC_01221 TaxID=2903782 RepID=UPI002251AC37|nr:hypothetical protein [Streptomyces sp. NBC_01221]MCX4792016.1 hypothetical protein [Streptomyces sp. NBC_01221]
MTDYPNRYANVLDSRVLRGFRHTTTECAEIALWNWVPTKDLPEHHKWLCAVVFRSSAGVTRLMAALALAEDTGHLTWDQSTMSAPATQREALMAYWDWRERIRRTDEERDRLIREALPLFGVNAEEVDADLGPALFEVTLSGDEYGRSDRVRKLLRMLRGADALAGAQGGGGTR